MTDAQKLAEYFRIIKIILNLFVGLTRRKPL